ncbi:hypothetical protein DFH06DRAFT_1392519 [Mycena polygramma]|nr:hypothetical protein DFH06DRAFT_1392519 [Mycena polygramma]
MVSWSSLSHCHNSGCAFNGSCRKFFPAGGIPLDGVEALGLMCICECFGVQHYEPSTSGPPPPTSTDRVPDPPQSAPKVSGSFVDAARLRKERQMGNIKDQSYDPSSKIHAESWSKLAPRPEKRKHATGARGKEEGPSKRPATGAAVASASVKVPTVKFTFVLAEKAKMVDEGIYRMPDSGKITSMYRCGHIKKIEFPPSVTPRDIEAIVTEKYSTLPAILDGRASMFGFVLLSKKSVSRGARPLLIAHKTAGEFDLQDLEWSVQNHRQERAYKRCIFISLSRWSPDLKLDIDDDSEIEFSDSSDNEPASDLSCSITDVHRLTLNICQPTAESWWPVYKSEPYIRAFDALPRMLRQLERLESPGEGSNWVPALVFELAADELFQELNFIVNFGDPADADYASRFTDYFRLGPNGLQPFITFLYRLYRATINWTPRLPYEDLARYVAIINSFATPIHAGVLHLRATVHRSVFDPPGFAELQEVLKKSRHRFGEAEISDRLVVLDLRVGHDGVAAFATSLEADFGSITSARAIRTSSLLVGPHGIDGFVEKILIPLLDSLSPDDPSYLPLRAMLGTFSGELSTKLVNFTKTQGKKKRTETNDAEDGPDGGSASAGGYKTRSKTGGQGSQYNTHVDDDNSDSSATNEQTLDEDSDDETMSSGSSVYEFEPTDEDREKFNKANDERMEDQNSENSPEPSPPEFEPTDTAREDLPNAADGSAGPSRPRFPYPETRPQRENPYEKPHCATPPPSRPKPRPAYNGTRTQAPPPPPPPAAAPTPAPAPAAAEALTGAEYLANLSTRRALVEEVLTRFPHPMSSRRLQWSSVSERPSNRRLWHQVVLVYHPDKNVDMPQTWREKCAVITKTLNNKFAQ